MAHLEPPEEGIDKNEQKLLIFLDISDKML
jgi:hypothetical protein